MMRIKIVRSNTNESLSLGWFRHPFVGKAVYTSPCPTDHMFGILHVFRGCSKSKTPYCFGDMAGKRHIPC